MMVYFLPLFVLVYVLQIGIEMGLIFLNDRHTRRQTEPPSQFADAISPVAFGKAKAYTLENLRFAAMSLMGGSIFFWLLLLDRGLNLFDLYAQRFALSGSLTHSVLFCAFVLLYFMVTSLPLRVYSIFVIEEKYGFNRMTLKDFVVDLLRGALLMALIGGPVLYLVFYLMRAAGEGWWLWTWAAVTLVQVVLIAVYPAFLAPLFNKFTPLTDGELKRRIEELAKRIGFKMAGIYVMDGSRRSGHSNAYFAGFGRFRKIVLYDTLMQQLTDDELVAVLAHEMGHNVKKHILTGTLFSVALMLVGLWILAWLRVQPGFYASFDVAPSPHAALVLFMLVSGPFMGLIEPFINLWSRHNEYQADAFSVEVTGNAPAMQSSLIKLARDNLSNLDPHPAYSFYHYTHPTTAERVRAIPS